MKIRQFLEFNTYCVFIWRISHVFAKMHLFVFAKFFWLINRIIYSVDIDPYATIGKNFQLIHGMGVVIGRYVSIGDNVKVFQNVTLGGNVGKKAEITLEDGHLLEIQQPQVGNNTTIYSNAVVVGPIVLGNNVTVGASAFVSKNVEDNKTVYANNKIR